MLQKWAIIFLIHAEDAKTKSYSDSLLAELQKTRFAENIRVFILRDTYENNNEENMKAILSELVYNKTKRKKELKELNNFGKINIGTSTNLSRIFHLVKKQTGEDSRFAIITWDHGFAFGVFNGNPGGEVLPAAKKEDAHHAIITNVKNSEKKSTNEKIAARQITHATEKVNSPRKNILHPEKTDMLTPEEIAKALQSSFTKKIDLFIMMNCWMQSVDTCYALADTVEVLVAAETTVDFIGYNFKGFINEICINPSISNIDLSAKIVHGIKRKYSNEKTEIAFSEIAVSAIRLAGMKQLKKIIDRISIKLQKLLNTNLQDIKNQRAACFELTHNYLPTAGIYFYYMVDLYDLFIRLNKVNLLTTKDMASINSWLDNYLIAKTIGKNFKKENAALSIYLPNNNEFIRTSTYYYKFYFPKGPLKMRRKFARDCSWAVFIDDFNKKL